MIFFRHPAMELLFLKMQNDIYFYKIPKNATKSLEMTLTMCYNQFAIAILIL